MGNRGYSEYRPGWKPIRNVKVWCKTCGAEYLDSDWFPMARKQLHTWECPDGLMPPEPFRFSEAGNKLPTGDRVNDRPYMWENLRPKKTAWHSKIPDSNALNKAVNKLKFVGDHEDRMEEECECEESNRDCLKADAEYYADPGAYPDCPGLVWSARAVLKRLGGPRLTSW